MRIVKVFGILVALFALMAFMAACGDDEEEAEPTKAPAAPTATTAPAEDMAFYMKTADHDMAKRGGIIRLAAHGPPAHFDIYASNTIANAGSQGPQYDLLVRLDPRDPDLLPIVPDLAESWEVASNGMEFTFNLREGVKFHDGSDFDSGDVKATYERIIFPPEGIVSTRSAIFPMETIAAPDALTVKFTLNSPRSGALMMNMFGLGWMPITTKEVLDANDGDLRKVDNYPGTGPFMYKERTTETWEHDANPNYWNPNAPYLDGIHMTWLKAWSPALAAAVLGNQVDWGMWLDPKTFEEVGKTDGMKQLIWWETDMGGQVLTNTEAEPFDDARVRRAVYLALDLNGMLEISKQFTHTLRTDWLLPPYGLAPDQVNTLYEFDPARAKERLAEAKSLMAAAGYADGYPDTLTMLVRESPGDRQVGAFMQAELDQKLGIKTEITIMQVSELFERQLAGEFAISPGANCEGLTRAPDPQLRACFSTNPDGSLSDQNLSRWNNSEYNALLPSFETEQDETKRIALAKQLAGILDTEAPIFGRNVGGILWGFYDYVKGLPPKEGSSAYDIYRWDYVWLDR